MENILKRWFAAGEVLEGGQEKFPNAPDGKSNLVSSSVERECQPDSIETDN